MVPCVRWSKLRVESVLRFLPVTQKTHTPTANFPHSQGPRTGFTVIIPLRGQNTLADTLTSPLKPWLHPQTVLWRHGNQPKWPQECPHFVSKTSILPLHILKDTVAQTNRNAASLVTDKPNEMWCVTLPEVKLCLSSERGSVPAAQFPGTWLHFGQCSVN